MNMEKLVELLPVLIPLAVIQFGLLAAALVHILKHPNYKVGNRTLWVLVSLISFIGPILYFVMGRADD